MSFVTKYEEQIGVSPMYREEKALKLFQHWKSFQRNRTSGLNFPCINLISGLASANMFS